MMSNDEVAQLLANYTTFAFATASVIGPTNSQTTIDNCRSVTMQIGHE